MQEILKPDVFWYNAGLPENLPGINFGGPDGKVCKRKLSVWDDGEEKCIGRSMGTRAVCVPFVPKQGRGSLAARSQACNEHAKMQRTCSSWTHAAPGLVCERG